MAARRGTEADRLYRLLRGDLDWVAMKAMEKVRARRYETAEALARDVRRFLANQPVEACPPSTGYRFGKFVRRNRVVLFSGLLVSTALVLGTIASTWQAIRASRAEQVSNAARLDEARQRAEAEASYRRARQAIDANFTLVSESKLLDVPGLQPLRKELLESALGFYKEFAVQRENDPALLAELAATYLRLAEIDHAMDRNDDAVAAIDQALEVIDSLRRDFPDQQHQLRKLAGYWKGFRRSKTRTEMPKNPEAALVSLSRLIDTLQALGDAYPGELGFQSDVAAICHRAADLLASGFSNRESRALWRTSQANPGEAGSIAAGRRRTSSRSGARARVSGELLAIGRAPQRSSSGRARRPGPARTARRRISQRAAIQGGVSVQLGPIRQLHCRAGSPGGRKALSPRPGIVGIVGAGVSGHVAVRRAVGQAQVEWAGFVIAGGDPAASQEAVCLLLVQVDATVARQPGSSSLRYEAARSLKNLSHHLSKQPGTLELQERLFRKALEMYLALANDFPDDPNNLDQAGHTSRFLGWLTRDAGRLDDARPCLEEAVSIFEALASADIPQRDGHYRALQADSLFQIAIVLARDKRHAEAEPLAAESAGIFEALIREFPGNKENRKTLAYVHRLRAEQLIPTGRQTEAEESCRRSIELNPKDFWTHMLFGHLLCEADRYAEAETCFRKAVEIDSREFHSRKMLLQVLTRQNKLPTAIEAFGQGRNAFDWFFLALAHGQVGHRDEAGKYRDRAIAWMEKNMPQNEQLLRFRAESERLLDMTEQPSATAAESKLNSTSSAQP